MMKMTMRIGRQLAFVPALLLLFGSLQAQNGIVKGVVVDANGEGIEGVDVRIEAMDVKRNYKVTTNKKGEFIHIGVNIQHTYRVIAEKEGFQSNYVQGIRPTLDRNDDSRDVSLTLTQGEFRPLAFEISDEQRAQLEETAEATRRRNTALTQSFNSGLEAYNAGDYETAKASFLKASEVAPEEPNVWGNLGRALASLGENEEAIGAYKKAIGLNPTETAFYQNLGNLYTNMGRDEEAKVQFIKAADIAAATNPAAAAASYYNMAVGYINNDKNEEAKEALQKAVAADPSHAEAHFQLGLVLVGLNEIEAAMPYLKKYLQLAPTGPNVESAKALVDALDQ